MSDSRRVLILSASVGEGHDAPARVLAEALREHVEVGVVDSLQLMGPLLEAVASSGMRVSFGSSGMSWLFDLEYLLFARLPVTRRLGQELLYRVAGDRLLTAVEMASPDVVVSTYPVATEVLGHLRATGRLDTPVCAAITDLAALRYWAHPGCDLHLVAHPESIPEVERIAGRGSARAVRGLTDPRFYEPLTRAEAEAPVVAVSGGGWGVGDLEGAVTEVLGITLVTVLCLCGRNEEVRAQIAERFATDRVRALGFIDDMPALLAGADVIVHSTAGLTVLEALMLGCRVVSYGAGIGHVRVNNRAFERLGLATVVRERGGLRAAVEQALAAPRRSRVEEFAALPEARDLVLDLL